MTPIGESAQATPGAPAARPSDAAFGWATSIAVLVLALYAPTLLWLWGRWTASVWGNAHGLLIPPVAAYAIWESAREHPPRDVVASPWGFPLLLAGLTAFVIDGALATGLLAAASLLLVLPGLSLLLFGIPFTKRIAFPLSFLAFMLPIPLGAIEGLVLLLRRISTVATASVLPVLGVPVFSEATTLHLAEASLEVADACSGFSTLYAALAVGVLTAYTTRTPMRRVLVLVAAGPLAVVANIVRVTILALLVDWQGSAVLATSLHELSGLATFGVVLPVIFWLGAESEPRMVAS